MRRRLPSVERIRIAFTEKRDILGAICGRGLRRGRRPLEVSEGISGRLWRRREGYWKFVVSIYLPLLL